MLAGNGVQSYTNLAAPIIENIFELGTCADRVEFVEAVRIQRAVMNSAGLITFYGTDGTTVKGTINPDTGTISLGPGIFTTLKVSSLGSGIAHVDGSGNVTSSAITAGEVPNLDAAKLTTGTLANARLDPNVLLWVTAPANSSSPGTVGQVARDGSGNFYVCYATNSWAKFAPTSTSF